MAFDVILILIFVVFLFIAGFLLGKYITEKVKWSDKKREIERQYEERIFGLEKKHIEEEKLWRADAVSRSRSTLMGKMLEQVAPFLPRFKYHPSDMRFLGSPVDYIVFEGMNEKDIRKVVFLEVKNAKSALNPQEKKLKEAIDSGKVSFEEFRIDDMENSSEKREKNSL